MDPGGYINNVYTTPPKPESSPAAPAQPSNTKDVGTNGHAANGVAPSEGQGAGIPQLLSDFASTIAARDGTSSALEYVASGIGAAVHSVVGVDPINSQKVSYRSLYAFASDRCFKLRDTMAFGRQRHRV